MATHKHLGPDTWLGSWEGEVMAMHTDSLRWLSPLRGAIVTTALTLIGLNVGGSAIGVPLAIGALFAAVADVDQVAGRRARTMLWITLWLTVATALGAIASAGLALTLLIAIPVTAVCGYIGVIGPRAAIAGVLCLVTFSAFTFTPMTPSGVLQAAAMVGLGGLIQTGATVVTTLIREPRALLNSDPPPSLRQRVAEHGRSRRDFARHAIRLVVAMEIAFVLQFVFTDIHSVWIPITVAWVTTPYRHGTATKSIGRIIGTLVGVVLLLLASWLTDYADATLVVALGISTFVALVMLRVNYSIAVIGVTGFMLSLFALAGTNVDVLGVDRVIDTLSAAVIVLIVSSLVLRGPSRKDRGDDVP